MSVVESFTEHGVNVVEVDESGLPRCVLTFVAQVLGDIKCGDVVEQTGTCQVERVVHDLRSVEHVNLTMVHLQLVD